MGIWDSIRGDAKKMEIGEGQWTDQKKILPPSKRKTFPPLNGAWVPDYLGNRTSDLVPTKNCYMDGGSRSIPYNNINYDEDRKSWAIFLASQARRIRGDIINL